MSELGPPPRGFTPGYVLYAAPQSISAYLVKERRKLREAQHRVAWLERLLEIRNSQVAKAEWPPKRNTGETRSEEKNR